MMIDHKRAHRVAYDYLLRQIDKMPAYANPARYWEQAWMDLLSIKEDANELLMELLAAEYNHLEKIWLETHKEGDDT